MQTIGIIGAGQMGRGIAQVCAGSGYNVIVQDIAAPQRQAAQADITKGLAKWVEKGQITAAENEAALKRLSFVDTLGHLQQCDLIIEAATENIDLKLKILEQASEIAPAKAILASNTSSISITHLAAGTKNPANFIGIHFMNPVPRMPLVEIIRGLATSEETFTAAATFVQRLKKQMVVSQDRAGFLVNRILLPMINEAVFTLYEGVGSAEDIDKAMVLGTNQPMGPLTLADFIGLDTCLAIMRVLHQNLGEDKYRPCPLLIQYVEAGWLGRKSKRGFFTYE